MDNFSKMVEGVKITIEKMKKTPAELPWYMSVEQFEMTLKELDKGYEAIYALLSTRNC